MKKEITKDPLELLGYKKIVKLNSAVPRIEYRKEIDCYGKLKLQIFFSLKDERIFINNTINTQELLAINKIREELW